MEAVTEARAAALQDLSTILVHVVIHVMPWGRQAAGLLRDIRGGLPGLPGADGAIEGAGGQEGLRGVPAAVPYDLPVILQPLNSLP